MMLSNQDLKELVAFQEFLRLLDEKVPQDLAYWAVYGAYPLNGEEFP